MHKKLQLFSKMIIDGHAPALNPYDLSAYVLVGISTDHECTDSRRKFHSCLVLFLAGTVICANSYLLSLLVAKVKSGDTSDP